MPLSQIRRKKYLTETGHGSPATVDRKIRDGRLPPPNIRDPFPGWTDDYLELEMRKRRLDSVQQES